jgi:hypothetical protein
MLSTPSTAIRPITFWKRLSGALGWTRSSYVLVSAFAATLLLIAVVWPLVVENLGVIDWSQPLWAQMDWLLLGIFGFMSLLIMAGADLKADALIVFVGTFGGLAIESWGTQTQLWTYFTLERPPLWIIPAWPIASLSIDRLTRFLGLIIAALAAHLPSLRNPAPQILYGSVFAVFYALMLTFVWPTANQSFTWVALALCALLIATPTDHRLATLTFIASAGLGYFLERWGNDERMLDVLYSTNPAPLCRDGAWHGGRRVLARGIAGQTHPAQIQSAKSTKIHQDIGKVIPAYSS